MKYIAVTGGVVSGLGKGITISSIGALLKASGYRVTAIKIDPYLNSDAGTMSPFEHGEVFVLDDGGEVDLDLGNYERFLDITLTRDHNITTGKAYHQVIRRERRGDYLGKTVQIIPHVTDAIQDWIERVAHVPVDGSGEPADVCLIEVGGTVGDIESMVFLEALRQFQFRVGPSNFCLVHVSLVPVLGSVGEQKTKPTQHGAKELRSAGLSPHVIVCRSGEALHRSTQDKIAAFCHVSPSNVLAVHDVSNIYHVPLMLQTQDLATILQQLLGLETRVPDLKKWELLAKRVDDVEDEVHIALVGKYTGLSDSYLSVIKALRHAAVAAGCKLVIDWIDASHLEPQTKETHADHFDDSWSRLKAANGVLVPGGFGDRGVEGKILAVQYARENRVPFLGICLGLQCAVMEYARNVLGEKEATSAEFTVGEDSNAFVVFMPEIDPSRMGGTMRLGSRRTLLYAHKDGSPSVAQLLYHTKKGVMERHRHRYEVDPSRVHSLEEAGLVFSGKDERGQRMEIVELLRDVHPFFFATQFHPEFKSHPHSASPPFYGFVLAASAPEDYSAYLERAKETLGEHTIVDRKYLDVADARRASVAE
eukprot:CAMPEP_0196782454 /NCGR_PEP_ID=MMETSP1104-20130614/11378_1 /TAXON_ID=33652 /ORGANISM="Cafeteria sp., Strain Caron Lab Isolate" /LENGTH=591 /DNA_ID=CAMNT_0042152687 /DNA_START=20 /DNA_END=1795 /DNA_ORIENTATION=+